MSIYKKLQDARVALHSMPLKKSGVNKFAGYNYFELGDFLPQTQRIFGDVGLCGVISYNDERATLTIHDTETEETIVITSPMREAALKGCHPIQNLGAVETYQRRYLWVAAMELVENDALDSAKPLDDAHDPTQGGDAVVNPGPHVSEKPSPPNPKFLAAVQSEYEKGLAKNPEFPIVYENLMANSGILSVSDLTGRDEQTKFWEDLKAVVKAQ